MSLMATRRTPIQFLKIILVVFALSYCCLILHLERSNFKKIPAYNDDSPEVMDFPHFSAARTYYYLSGGPDAILSGRFPPLSRLLTGIFLRTRAGYFVHYACQPFFVITTINAP